MYTINKISSYLLLSLFTIPFLASWLYSVGWCLVSMPDASVLVLKCVTDGVGAATVSYNVFINFVSFSYYTIFGVIVFLAFALALMTRIIFLVKYKNVATFIFSPVMLTVFMYLAMLALTFTK